MSQFTFNAAAAKVASDFALLNLTNVATLAAITAILTSVQNAANAAAYNVVIDLTTYPGTNTDTIEHTLAVDLGYTVKMLGTNMTIDWSVIAKPMPTPNPPLF